MTGKTHMAIGVAATLATSTNQPVKNQLLLIGAAAVGSLLPDLDHPQAKLNQKLLLFNNNFFKTLFYLVLSGVFLYIYKLKGINYFLFLAIGSILISVSSHRGFTHSIIGFLSFWFLIKVISKEYNLQYIHNGFIIGYFMHLVADFFTPRGIKLFFPFNESISSPISIKINKGSENLILIILSLYAFTLVFKTMLL